MKDFTCLMVPLRCTYVTFITWAKLSLETLYRLVKVIKCSFSARTLPGCWIFTLLVSVSFLCHTLTVQCSKCDGNRSWSVTTYLIQIINTMIQGIAKGAPRKEIDPTMISNHLRK